MPSFLPVVTINNHAKVGEHKPPSQSFEAVRSVVSPPKVTPMEHKKIDDEELKPTYVPKNNRIFGANFARELHKNEKKKVKEIEYLPGEKLVIELQKSLKKDKEKKQEKEHISTLTKSINNVINDLEL